MSPWKRWLQVGPRNPEADVDDEIAFHLGELVRELQSRGLSPAEAHAEAARRFGSPADTRAAVLPGARITERRARQVEWLSELWQDLRFGLRQARRQPAFTLTLLLVLSLGIGAHAAIVTAFHAVLLRPLPYHDAGQLVQLWETAPNLQGGRSEASFPDFEDWRAETRDLFAGIEGYDGTNMVLTGRGPARMMQGGRVTAGFLRLLGVRPAIGRDLRVGEDIPGGSPVVVVSHGFWLREFGGDTAALGRSLVLNGNPYEIVGVLPRGFHFGSLGAAEILIPLDRAAETRTQRYNHWLNVLGRLRDGVSIEQARSGLATVVARLSLAHANEHAGRSGLVAPLREELTGTVRPVLIALAGAVGVLLLIACINAGSLLLARALTRMPELRVRAAIGAGRGRIVRQLATEAVAMALVAGAAGAALAHFGLRVLVGAIPERVLRDLPALRGVDLDWRILGYTLLVSLVAGLAFGVLPGLRLSRNLAPGQLRNTPRSRGRDLLVVGQLALTVVLLVGAGLLTRSLTALVRADPGFRAARVVTFQYALNGPAYEEGHRQQQFAEGVLNALGRMPGVQSVGAVTNLPLQAGGTNTFRVEGLPEPDPSARPEVTMRGVAGDYFQAMGIRLLAGRALGNDDREGRAPVLLLSESAARGLFGEPAAALGARLRFYAFPDTVWTVVGVAADVTIGRLDEAPLPTAYYSHLQNAENRMSIAARVTGSTAAALAAASASVAAIDASVPVYRAETMAERVGNSPAVFLRRYPLMLIGVFALVALILSVAGLYGTLAFAVASRTRELGVRAALGATPRALIGLVVRHGGVLTAAGIAAGLLVSLAGSRAIAGLLYGVPAGDPLTLLAVAVGLAAIALLASWIPARRASRLNPVLALKAE
jgi:predicted permease